MVLKFKKFFRSTSSKHVIFGVVFKILAVLFSFVSVPLILDVLSVNDYGVWITLSSFLVWIQFFDFGLSNGLKNLLGEAVAKKDLINQSTVLSNAFLILAFISVILFVLVLSIGRAVNWTSFFRGANYTSDLNIVVPLVLIIIVIQFSLTIVITIFQTIGIYSAQQIFSFIAQLCSFLFLVFIKLFNLNISLIDFAVIFASIPIVVLVGFSVYLLAVIRPEWHLGLFHFDKAIFSSLMNLSSIFLVTKAAALMLITTDTILIAKLFDSYSVVVYNVHYKYFNVLIVIFGAGVSQYWVQFKKALIEKRIVWVKEQIFSMHRAWYLLIFFGLFLFVFLREFIYFSSRNEFNVDYKLAIVLFLYVVIYSWTMIYSQFINASGKLRLNLIVSVTILVLNLPLSIYFSKSQDFGVVGVILATVILLSIKAILYPLQYSKLINKRASGIWSK